MLTMRETTQTEAILEAERTLAAAYLSALRQAALAAELDTEDRDDPGLQVLRAFVKVHAVYPRLDEPRLIVIGLAPALPAPSEPEAREAPRQV